MLPEALTQIACPEQMKAQIGNVLEVHFGLGGTDGVALMARVLDSRLKTLGIPVYPFAADVPHGCPELDYRSDDVTRLREAIFAPIVHPEQETGLLANIYQMAGCIEDHFKHSLQTNDIRTVHVRNLMSLVYLHPAASLAVFRLIKKRPDIHWVLHHHDLPWETSGGKTPHPKIQQLLDTVMLPDLPQTSHIVISSLAAHQLRQRRGIRADIIPDATDFQTRVEACDDSRFRKQFGFGKDDLLVGMMTRIIRRKNIETAVEFMFYLRTLRHGLEKASGGIGVAGRRFTPDSRMILVLTQSKDLDPKYLHQLRLYAAEIGVEMAYIGDHIVSDATYTGQPDKYPFYGSYGPMDLIIYPTRQEGFGNQLLEAIWAEKPIVMQRYPVAAADICPYIPHLMFLGDNRDLILLNGSGMTVLRQPVVSEAAYRAVDALSHPDRLKQHARENLIAARKRFDIGTLAPVYLNVYRRRNAINGLSSSTISGVGGHDGYGRHNTPHNGRHRVDTDPAGNRIEY